MKRSRARSANKALGGIGAAIDAPIETAHMISGVVALLLLHVVRAYNLHDEVVVQVVPACIEPMDFITEDDTYVSFCLLLLL